MKNNMMTRRPALFSAALALSAALLAAPVAQAQDGGGDARLFGEEFQLNAVRIEFELEENDLGQSEVSLLDAQQDVTLEMQQFTIAASRLTYSDLDKKLHAYGNESRRCIVYQGEEGTESRCDHFVYHTETGETEFIGRPEIEIAGKGGSGGGGGESNVMRADNINIERDDRAGRTHIRLRSNAVLGSRSMIERQIDNPNTNNPTIVIGGGEGERKGPPLILDNVAAADSDAVAPTGPVRVTEENPGTAINAVEEDFEGIKGERSYGNRGRKKGEEDGGGGGDIF